MTLKISTSPVPFEFKLTNGLMFYQNAKRSSEKLAVLFSHEDGKWTEPRVMDHDEISDLAPNRSDTEVVVYPKNVLYYSESRLVWYIKRGVHNIKLASKDPEITWGDGKTLNNLALPQLVFKVYKGKLYVAATKRGRPTETTKLYKAPFRGIDVHGNTMGSCNVVKPKTQKLSDLEEWQNAFLKSRFNQRPKGFLKESLNMNLKEFILSY